MCIQTLAENSLEIILSTTVTVGKLRESWRLGFLRVVNGKITHCSVQMNVTTFISSSDFLKSIYDFCFISDRMSDYIVCMCLSVCLVPACPLRPEERIDLLELELQM